LSYKTAALFVSKYESSDLSNPCAFPVVSKIVVNLKAYIVEDNPRIRDNLVATLEELTKVRAVGFSDNEADSKHWLSTHQADWDLAIVDLFLKSGSGLEVLAACKASMPLKKIIVLSNYATPEVRQRCIKLGADAVFDKSNDIDALLAYCNQQSPAIPD
jgi:two-component system, OmpR family, response regulator